ncbi:uncharacterized protein [Aquarana catesbeiana]|uniref:uncharacterized protein n=1 Tax=Aquarana catesbeiana TaxID=8400 RepID=UPI003CCA46EC
MRTLLILGGLIVCVLLVTPSNGDRNAKPGKKQQNGGEKLMDSRNLKVPAGPREGNVKLRCCEWPIIEDCMLCQGMGDPFVRPPSHNITADDEKKSMDSGDLTVPAEPSESLVMETTSKLPCCRWPIITDCMNCPRMDPISRLPSHDITADDEKKSMDSGDLTVPAEPSEIPIMETTTKLPCCRWPLRPPCKKCTGGGSGTESVNDIPADDEKKSMDSKDLTIPAGPIENLIMEITSKLPCCRWPIMGPCKLCPRMDPISRLPSHNITADDEKKSMDSGDLTVPAEPSESLIMETTSKLPCCEWPKIWDCKNCPGGSSGKESVNNITADDEKSMDSGDLTVPAEPSEIRIMETTTKLPCCRWPRRDPCKNCTGGGGPFVRPPSHNITADDEKKSMDSGDLTVPAEASESLVMETTTQLPCCRWPLRKPCKKCPGMGSGTKSDNDTTADDEKKSMDSGDLTVPAEPSEILVMETTTKLPCCRWSLMKPCKKCPGMGSGTKSDNDTTADDEKKSMDSGDLTVPAEPSESLIMETTSKLPCCRWPIITDCMKCPGMGSGTKSDNDTTADDEKKSMDSGDLTVPAEPSESLIMETTSKLPCCRWPIITDCKKCPGMGSGTKSDNDTTADDEKKSMDSGDLTVPAEPSESLIMETTSKLPCCRWPIITDCKKCPGMGSGTKSDNDTTADDEKKSMDSGDLTVPAEPSEILVMETTTKLPCCRWSLMKPCKKCPGMGSGTKSDNDTTADDEKKSMDYGNLTVPAEPSEIRIMETTTKLPCCRWPIITDCKNCPRMDPISQLPSHDITTDDEKKSMDSGDLTVPAKPSEILVMETTSKLPCCEWPIIEDCMNCPGKGPMSRLPSNKIIADDEKKSMDSGDLTVPAGPIENLIMEITSKLPCCHWPIMGPCKLCPRMDPISRLPSHDITADDEKNSMDSRDSTVPARPSESPIMEIPVGLQCCQWPLKPPCKLCPGMGTDIWNLVERSHHHR